MSFVLDDCIFLSNLPKVIHDRNTGKYIANSDFGKINHSFQFNTTFQFVVFYELSHPNKKKTKKTKAK